MEKKSYILVGGDGERQCLENWEEVPDEDLWEDGELNLEDVQSKVFRFLDTGHYMLIRRKDE